MQNRAFPQPWQLAAPLLVQGGFAIALVGYFSLADGTPPSAGAIAVLGFLGATTLLGTIWIYRLMRSARSDGMTTGFNAIASDDLVPDLSADSLPIGIAFYNERGKLIYTNSTGRELLGSHLDRTYCGRTGQPYKCDRLPKSRALKGEVAYADDLELHRPDGSIVPLEVRAHPFGRGAIELFNEIGQRREAESTREARDRLLLAEISAQLGLLERSQAQLDALFQSAPVGLSLFDTQLHFVRVNSILAEIDGLDPEAYRGKTLGEVMPELASQLEPLLEQVVATAEPILNREISGPHPSRPSTLCHWSVSYFPVLGAKGEILGVGESVVDISDRVAAETAIRQSEQRFRAIFEQVFQFVGLLTPQGIAIETNQTSLDFAGLTREEAIGKPFWEAYCRSLSEPTQAQLQEAIARAAAGELVRAQVDVQGADRAATLDFSLRPIYDPDGTVALLISEGRDISDRVATEAALEQSETRYQALLEAIPDLLMRMDGDGICSQIFCGEEVRVYNPQSIHEGANIRDILPSQLAEQRLHYAQLALATGCLQTYEYQLDVDGDRRSEEARLVSCGEDEVLVIVRDVTQRRRAEEALRASEAELRALFAAMTDVVVVRDRDGYCLKVAPTSPYLVAPPEEMLGRTLHETMPPDLAERLGNALRMAIDAQTRVELEYCIVDLHGDRVWLSASISPLDEEKAILVARNISDRVRAEAQLRDSLAQNRALLRALPDLAFRLDERGTYLDYFSSPGIANLVDPETCVGRSAFELLPETVAQPLQQAIARALDSRSVQTFEQQISFGDRVLDEEVRVAPASENEVLVLVRDIGDRVRAETQLRQSERRYRAIALALPDLAFRVDARGVYLDYIPSESVTDLFNLANCLGSSFAEILPEAIARQHYRALERALATGEVQAYEQEIAWGDRVLHEEVRVVACGENEVLFLIRDISDRVAAREELRAKEAQNRTLLEAIPDLMLRIDARGYYRGYVRANSAIDYIPPSTDIVGRHASEFLPPELLKRQLAAIERALGTKQTQSFEQRMQIGDRLQVEEVRVVASGEDEALFMIRDISARKAAEDQLRRSRATLAEAQAIANFGSWDLEIDTQTFTCSPEFARIFGCHPESLNAAIACFIPSDRPRFQDAVAQAISDGQSADADYFLRLDDGSRRCVTSRIARMTAIDGESPKLLGTVFDVTARVEAAALLRQSEAKLEAIVDSVSDGIVIVSLEGQILFANPAAEFLVDRPIGELVGKNWVELTRGCSCFQRESRSSELSTETPQDIASWLLVCGRRAAANCGEIAEIELVQPDGGARICEMRVANIPDWEGESVNVISLHDITDRKAVEEQLRRNRATLAEAQALAHFGSWEYEIESRTFTCSPEFARIFGCDPQTPPSFDQVVERLTLSDRPGFERAVARALSDGKSTDADYFLRLDDGSLRCVTGRIARVTFPDGRPAKLLGTVFDVTARVQAEALLRQSEEKLDAIVDSVADGIVIVSQRGRILFANPAAEELLARDLSDLLGSEWGVPISEMAEIEICRPDGEVRTCEMRVANIPDWEDESAYAIALRDVSDRKAAEAALQASEERWRSLVQNAPSYVFAIDGKGQLSYSNRPLGTASDPPASALSLYEWVVPEHRGLVQAAIACAFEVGEAARCEIQAAVEATWLDVSLAPIWQQGGVAAAIGLAIDVSDRKAAEAQLEAAKEAAEAANLAKSSFLANMSHELRSPLNAILGFAQILQRSSLPKDRQEQVEIIYRSGQHLLELINDILDLSKIEAGRLTYTESDFEIDRLLRDLEEMFSLRVRQKQLHFQLERDPQLPRYLSSDRLKLRQILINLLGNAVKFTEDGSIHLRAFVNQRGEGDLPWEIAFAVEDTGVGIATEDRTRLFEPFVQTEAGLTAPEGTGLGLAIVRRYAQLLGGDVEVSSRVGEGSTFTVVIRARPAVGASDTVEEKEVLSLAPGQPEYRILIVDDRALNRLLLSNLLRPLGLKLEEAANGAEAVTIWERWQPHLIFMDVRMPQLDGYEAARRIKASSKGQSTAIVALTASAFEEDRAMALAEGGCDDFLRKPLQAAEIYAALTRHLGVEFVEQAAPAPSPGEDLGEGLAALAQLPDDCREQLREAIFSLDEGAISAAIAEISQQNDAIAPSLNRAVADFAYDRILKYL